MMNIYMIIKFIFDERMNCVSINESEKWGEDDDEIFVYRLGLWCIEKLSEKSIDPGLAAVIYGVNKKWLIWVSVRDV